MEWLRGLFTSSRDDHLYADEEPRRRGLIIAVCVLISFVLWLTFTLQEVKVVTLEVPTQVVNMPTDQALEQLPPPSVDVQVEGEGLQLLWMYYNPPVVPIDVGQEQVNLPEALSLPDNVRLQDVMPRQVSIAKEVRVTRRIPIRPRVHLETPPAYELVGVPRIEPDSVTVTGARSVIGGLEYWPTDSVAVENMRDSIDVQIPLADTLNELVSRDVRVVTFHAQAGRFAEATREIEVEVTGVPAEQNVVTLEPSTVRVRYRVLFEELFESQRAQDFFATVSYDQIRADTTGFVRPQLHLPSDLIIRDPEMIPARLQYYTFVAGE